jgi:cobalt-zinc-cadmium efflux system membrane fusion protein
MKVTIAVAFVVAILASCSRPTTTVKEEKPKETEREKGKLIEMAAEAQEHAGLQAAPVEVRQLTDHLEVTGTVQPVDSRVGHVRPLASGRVSDVRVRVGDRVDRDTVLASFDNIEAGEVLSQYRSARAELQRLKTQLAVSTQQLDRSRRLVDIGAASKKELELAEAEPKSIAANIEAQESVVAGLSAKLTRFGVNPDAANLSPTTSIRSPFSGVVTKVNASPGEVVNAESELFQIADVSQVWVQAEVYEKDLNRIQVRQTAAITVDTYPDEQFLGTVAYIGDILDPQTRTVKVRCELGNPKRKLKLDMFATVKLPTRLNREALAVPTEAVQQIEGKNVVFIQKGPTTFEPRIVTIGESVQGMTEIMSGLEKGQSVVSRGAFHLKSIVLGKQLGEEGEEH